jgi:hypothetical protein
VSCKYTRESVRALAERGGLVLDAWMVDPDGLFAEGLLVKPRR